LINNNQRFLGAVFSENEIKNPCKVTVQRELCREFPEYPFVFHYKVTVSRELCGDFEPLRFLSYIRHPVVLGTLFYYLHSGSLQSLNNAVFLGVDNA